ncbi:MAG: hypothetical protein KUG77_30250 [Nannocystaceae bacterium]|nr:hypothetical protein [Nannocystaceae bacterium]
MTGSFPPVAELLPHGPSMCFLSTVLAFEGEVLECEVIPGEGDAAFVREGVIPAAVSLEYMAQAIAAFVSLKTGRGQGEPGFVMAVRRFKISVPSFELHRPLRVRVERRWGESSAARFDGTIYEGDAVVATGAMSVFRPDKEEQE